jgi:aminopeptidase N
MIVAVSAFNMGAMENKGLNIFNDKVLLASPETATDDDYARIESVVAHEYFHNWTGDRITCRDWFQLSLKEGLTVFRDQKFSGDMRSHGVQRIQDVRALRARQFPEDAGPLAHPVQPQSYIEINNFYTSTIYEKGSEVIGMGVDFTPFMRWYEQAGTPEVSADAAYDAGAKTLTLTLSQYTAPTADGSAKKPFYIPVAVGLLGPGGEDLIGTRLLALTEPSQTFTFEGISARPVLSILRDFSAPVKLKTNQSDDDLRFLMVHDTDGFNKWDAGQTYFKRVLNAMIDAGQTTPPAAFVDTMGRIIDEALAGKTDPALLARSLSLPDVAMIGLDRKTIDPDAIYAARQGAIKAVAEVHREKLYQLYGLLDAPKGNPASGIAKGRRALKNLVLRYLDDSELAKRQYDHALNLTDRMGALSVLTHHETPEAEAAFAHCAKTYADNHLIIDNWFRAKASGIRPQLLKDLSALAADKNFDWKTPNRVRSLYGMFGLNAVMFHAKDGSGYRFSADAIMKLDAINPEVAVQIMRPFREWRHYTADRQEKMKAALIEIARQPNLSRDVYEIVSKTLGDAAMPA